jgi:hypothetical protein
VPHARINLSELDTFAGQFDTFGPVIIPIKKTYSSQPQTNSAPRKDRYTANTDTDWAEKFTNKSPIKKKGSDAIE